MTPVSGGQEPRRGSGAPRLTAPHTAAVEVLVRPGAYLKARLWQDLLPSSGGCWQGAFWAGGLTASVSPWLLAGSCLQCGPLRGAAPSMAGFSSKPAGESLLAR